MKRRQRNLIRGMRGVLELTQSQLSAMTGLSASRICRIERGTFPIRPEEAALIGDALGLNLLA